MFFVYYVTDGFICSKFETEAEADALIAANDDVVMAKVAAPNDHDTVNYLKYVDNNFIAETEEDIYAETLIDFRIERDEKLAESDWTQVPDSPLSDSKKTEWQTYRQALRDIPSQEGFDPLNPTYPTEPT